MHAEVELYCLPLLIVVLLSGAAAASSSSASPPWWAISAIVVVTAGMLARTFYSGAITPEFERMGSSPPACIHKKNRSKSVMKLAKHYNVHNPYDLSQ